MTERLSDKIYYLLRERILAGDIPSNTFLVESDVAEKYAVSKAPVKTALQALAQQGYLTCFPRRGYMVTSVTAEEYESVRELRIHIEQLSIRLAIQRASEDEIMSLWETLPGDLTQRDPYKTSNTRFHTRLAEITHNPYIRETLHRLLGIASHYAFVKNVNHTMHEKIIDALLRRDVEQALAYLGEDLNADSPHYRIAAETETGENHGRR